MKIKTVVALVIIGLLIGGAVALTAQYLFPTTGIVKATGLTVTWMDGTPVTTIDWSDVYNNTAYTMEPMNITNIGNTPCTLVLSTANPSSNIITLSLTWNYTDTILQPNSFVIVELTQTITAPIGTYTYTTVITANEATP